MTVFSFLGELLPFKECAFTNIYSLYLHVSFPLLAVGLISDKKYTEIQEGLRRLIFHSA